MSNLLTNSILHIDAAASSAVTGIKRVRLIQWVDDIMDVIDGQDLVFVMGQTTFTTKSKIGSDVGQQSIVLWQMGPFNPGFPVDGISVTTIDHGVLYVWID